MLKYEQLEPINRLKGMFIILKYTHTHTNMDKWKYIADTKFSPKN